MQHINFVPGSKYLNARLECIGFPAVRCYYGLVDGVPEQNFNFLAVKDRKRSLLLSGFVRDAHSTAGFASKICCSLLAGASTATVGCSTHAFWRAHRGHQSAESEVWLHAAKTALPVAVKHAWLLRLCRR